MRKRKTRNNKGFSMVELLVAFGIMGVIVTTVGYMMTTSSKTYSSLSTESQLQSEAQLVANAISELAIDSFDAGNTLETKYECKIDPAVNDFLVLMSKDKNGGSYKNTRYQISHEGNELYLITQEYDSSADSYTAYNKSLLGQYITGFTVNLNRVKDDNLIAFQLVYTKNGRSYTGDYQVYMRNKAYTDSDKADPGSPTSQFRKLLLTPSTIIIDIKGNQATGVAEPVGWYSGKVDASAMKSMATKITFTATPYYSGSVPDETSAWKLQKADSRFWKLSTDKSDGTSTKAATTDLEWVLPTTGASIKDSPNSEFEVVATHTTPENNSKSQIANVMLRIVRSITMNASGVSEWKTEYEGSKYGYATRATDAQGYVTAGSSITIIPSINQSNVSTDLTWQLYVSSADASDAWVLCTDTGLATLGKGSNKSNSVKLGKNATSTKRFKVVATSVFDPTVSGEYIFGIIPEKRPGQDPGDHSRGYKLNIEDYIKKRENLTQSDWPTPKGIYSLRIEPVNDDPAMTEEDKNNKDISSKYHWDPATGTIYADINQYAYSADQRRNFYKERILNIYIRYYYDAQEWDSNLNQMVTRERITDERKFEYHLKAVVVEPSGSDSFCVKKGKSSEVDVKTHYYNLTAKNEWGMYVKENQTGSGGNIDSESTEFSTNLNRDGWENSNQYLSLYDTTSYGRADLYNEIASFSLGAKASTKEYPSNYLTLRVTLDEYYNLTNDNNSYHDFKVYIANVDGQDLYLPGPGAVRTNNSATTIGWPSNVPDNETGAVAITGIATDGSIVTNKAKVYKSGKKYKCIYNEHTYTFDTTNNYWKK